MTPLQSPNQSKLVENSKKYRFLTNSDTVHQRSKEATKGKCIRTRSGLRRAEQAADEEDTTSTSSNFNRLNKRHSSSDESNDMNHKRKVQKSSKANVSNNGDGKSFSSDESTKSHQPRFYQRDEEIKIIDFIIKHRAFSQVKGNTLWKLMEATQVLPDRTPQSMKERFRRYILPRLEKYDHLSQTDIENFRNPPAEEMAATGHSENRSEDVSIPEAQDQPNDESSRVQSESNIVRGDESKKDR